MSTARSIEEIGAGRPLSRPGFRMHAGWTTYLQEQGYGLSELMALTASAAA